MYLRHHSCRWLTALVSIRHAVALPMDVAQSPNSSIAYPVQGLKFTVPQRPTMTLIYKDLLDAFGTGLDLNEGDIRWAGQTYSDQLRARAQKPGRNLDSAIGNADSGELDCRIHGAAFWLEPEITLESKVTLRDVIDALNGVAAAAAANTKYLQEAEIIIAVKGEEMGSLWMLNKFRGKYVPFGSDCVDIHFGPITEGANTTMPGFPTTITEES